MNYGNFYPCGLKIRVCDSYKFVSGCDPNKYSDSCASVLETAKHTNTKKRTNVLRLKFENP